MNTKNIITSLTASLLAEVKKVMKNEKPESLEEAVCAYDKSGKLVGRYKSLESAKKLKPDHKYVNESLKGDQHKIDANKNGKVDAHDFKLLRKKKSVAETYLEMTSGEEVEEIDEANKSDRISHLRGQIDQANRLKASPMGHLKVDHRKLKAYKDELATLTKEEVEELDELSKGTLANYAGSAINDVRNANQARIRWQSHEGKFSGYDSKGERFTKTAKQMENEHSRVAKNREQGVRTAIKKLAKEEVEDLDELSKGTLGSYVKKATSSAIQRGVEHGTKKAERDEIDRNLNRHMSFSDKDKVHDIMKTTHDDVQKPREKALRRYQGIHRAVNRITKEEVEDLGERNDENKIKKNVFTAKLGQKLAREKGFTFYADAKAAGRKILRKEETDLTQEEIDFIEATMDDLDEGRGRPPKEGSDAFKRRQEEGQATADEPRQHPIQQLERIKRDMRGGADFLHRDGSTHHVTGSQASKILDKYQGLKPSEKETMQKEIHGSHAGLKKHL